MIDEYRIFVHPVILGGGKPVFQEQSHRVGLELVESRTFDSQVVGTGVSPHRRILGLDRRCGGMVRGVRRHGVAVRLVRVSTAGADAVTTVGSQRP